jgi:hypothetical protein
MSPSSRIRRGEGLETPVFQGSSRKSDQKSSTFAPGLQAPPMHVLAPGEARGKRPGRTRYRCFTGCEHGYSPHHTAARKAASHRCDG